MADDETTVRGGSAAVGARGPAPRKAGMGAAVAAARKAAAAKAATTKAATTKRATTKRATTKAATTKAPAKKAPALAKAAPARKGVSKRAPAAANREAPTAAKRAPVKKLGAKKVAPATKAAKAATTRGTKAAAAKATTTRVAKAAPTRTPPLASRTARAPLATTRPARRIPASRLAGEQTFADDLTPPAPEPARPDPAAGLRARLRAAAASIEARQAPAPAPAATSDEPVTRVLIGPAARAAAPVAAVEVDEPLVEDDEPAADEFEADEFEADEADVDQGTDEDEDEDEEEDEEDDEWAPPELVDDSEAAGLGLPPLDLFDEPPPPPTPLPTTVVTAPPPAAPAPSGATPERRGGVGVPVLAIVLALVLPLVGAVVGFFLATRARRRNARGAGLARVVAILALVAWLVAGGIGAAMARDQGIDYSKLKVGDCFDSASSTQVRGVKVKPCVKTHNSEIFFLVTNPAAKGAAYPGKDALVQFAADACLGQPLTDYLGIPLEQSKLKDFEIVPQASAWKDGKRILVCGLDTGTAGKITGSIKGTRR